MNRSELIADAKEGLLRFLHAPHIKNQWLYLAIGDVYCRKNAHHAVGGAIKTTFDVANIELNSKYRGFGILPELLEWLNSVHSYDGLFIESIQNEGFGKSLIDAGWQRTASTDDFNVYRPKDDFDPTRYTIDVQPTLAAYCDERFEATVKEIPAVMVFEPSEGRARTSMYKAIRLLRKHAFQHNQSFPEPSSTETSDVC